MGRHLHAVNNLMGRVEEREPESAAIVCRTAFSYGYTGSSTSFSSIIVVWRSHSGGTQGTLPSLRLLRADRGLESSRV